MPLGTRVGVLASSLRESVSLPAHHCQIEDKNGNAWTGTNGVGVAGGLNENAGIVAASVVVFACDLCRSRRASAGKLTGVVHASVEVVVP